MNNLIFHPALNNELVWLLDNPSKIPNVLCFYGVPAQGKTEFAKYLATQVSDDTGYYDANSHMGDSHDTKHILKSIKSASSTYSLLGEGKQFKRCFIIDEWHDFTDKRQDSFKVTLDSMEKLNCLVIICCNTDINNSINKVLTPAIKSRCHLIRFDVLVSQVDKVAAMTKEKFPLLELDFIKSNLPDWRVIKRKIQMM